MVGRAYYAAYGVAKQYAAQHLDFRVHERPDDHERLPGRFISHGLPRVGIRLKELRDTGGTNATMQMSLTILSALPWTRFDGHDRFIDELAARRASST